MPCRPIFVEDGLIELMSLLDRSGYDFVTTTHARVPRRKGRWAAGLRDVLGWSSPFEEGLLEPEIERTACAANGVTEAPEGLRSRLHASRILGVLFLHSAYPSQGEDAVFLAPEGA